MFKLISWRLQMIAVSLLAALVAPAQAQLPLAELAVGMHRIEAELAHTPESRQIGLMNRKSMPEQRGMVFVFTSDARHCMWMKNTLLPLSVAFIDARGRILNIERMQPQTENSHCAAADARYALEMNQGWFAARGIAAGHKVLGLERLPGGS